MPTITLSKRELLKHVGKRKSEELLKQHISMLGTDLEGIDGDAVSVEIFPNRPDLLSQQGFNRALASYTGVKTGLAAYAAAKSGERVIVEKSVAKCRPYTSCAIVKGLKITPEKLDEIIQIQEKLHITFGRNRKRCAIGIYPMEHITFPITFTGMKPKEITFVPLEMKSAMRGDEILEAHPKGQEFAHLMEGLGQYACFVDAAGEIMSMTPVINSEHTGKITEKTTDVFVECSGFDQRVLDQCINMIVTALADMGGKVYSVEVQYPGKKITTPNLAPAKMKLDAAYINKIIGLSLSQKEIGKFLERMGYGVSGTTVLIPAYRTDILHQADLAEDVAIAYGFQNIPEILPEVATIAEENPFNKFCNVLRSMLVGHGLLEAHNFNLIGSETQTTKMETKLKIVQLANNLSEEYDSLRAWLFPSLLETLQRNKQHEYPQEFFEVGRIFLPGESETGVVEMTACAAVLCGEQADYTAIRQILDSLAEGLGVALTYKATKHTAFIPGRVAAVKIGKETIAYIGEIAPQVLSNFEIEMPVAAFGINLSTLFELLE